jgi:putative DNA methylase
MTGKDLWYKPKLIEVALPLEDISKESSREKSIRYSHPSTLHLWWSRKPVAAARAVLFAQLVDDPSAHPDTFPTEEEQKAERERLHGIISRLVVWENIHDEKLLKEAHHEILKSTDGDPPAILDPFAGGGSIPLEAQRLGLEAQASDLNPVAVLINKALIEIPQNLIGHTPVFPGASGERLSWPGTTGLAEDIRRYARWIHEEADRRIAHLYPKVRISGVEAPVIAWIWARTVTCPNPACAGTMPLTSKFWLGKKKGKERYVIPIPDGKRVRFDIGGPGGTPREGTVNRSGAVCLICNTPVPFSYIRVEGKAGRMGAQLMAIAVEGKRQRHYLAPTEADERIADVLRPDDSPEVDLPEQALGFRIQGYGMRTWADLFTNRQLTALSTFMGLVREAREYMVSHEAELEYANAVTTYLALAVSRITGSLNNLSTWNAAASKESVTGAFRVQALPMIWDFGESNPLLDGQPTEPLTSATWVARAIESLPSGVGHAVQADAATRTYQGVGISTDPPYYDNMGYSSLSDFFYVWLRQMLHNAFPGLMETLLTPKAQELVADPFTQGSDDAARRFFEEGFKRVFTRIRESARSEYPITVYYAFKQAETDSDGQQASTGWETLLEGLLSSGWTVTGTWPMRTERSGRTNDIGNNALASSIVLACRSRPSDAGFTDRRGLISALREEFPDALRRLEQGKIAPVDLRQAAIGPGMAVFSRYARVNEPDGSPMRVRAALSLINQVLDEKLSQLEGNVSADTRFSVEWFKQHQFDEGPYGTAETLSKGIDTSIDGLERAGVLRSRAGKVKLLSVRDLPDFYDPATDERTSEWEICLHLAKALEFQGADVAAALMAAARDVPGIDLDDVMELAYLLYSIAEKKGWAETALLFNNLGTSWTDLEDASRKVTGRASGQGEFTLEFGSDDGDE